MVQNTEGHYYYAVGKRKNAVAVVRLYTDSGPIIVNGKPMEEAFPWDSWQQTVNEPFIATETVGQFRIVAKVTRRYCCPGRSAETRYCPGDTNRHSEPASSAQEGRVTDPRCP